MIALESIILKKKKKKKKLLGNKNITTNIYRIQAYDSIMWGYLYIGFIDFLLKGKSVLEHNWFN